MSSGPRRAFRSGLLANGVSQFSQIVIQLAQLPLLRHWFGEDSMGIWNQMIAINMLLSLQALNVQQSVGNEMLMAEGRGDRDRTISLYNSGWNLLWLVTVPWLFVLLGLTQVVPWQAFVQSDLISTHDLGLMASGLVLAAFIAQHTGMMDAGYRAGDKYAYGLIVLTLLNIVEVACGLALAFFTKSVAMYGVGFAIGKILSLAFTYLNLRRVVPWIPKAPTFQFRNLPWSLLKEGLGYSAAVGSQVVANDGTKSVITQAMSSATVATNYTSMRTLARFASQISRAFSNILWVELARMLGRGEITESRLLHRKASRVSFWVTLLVTGAMCLAAPTVYRLWLQGEKLQFQPVVYLLIAGSIVLNSIWSVSYIVPMSINKGSRLGIIVFCFQAFMLLAVFMASRQWGLKGAAAAWFINELVLCFYVTSRAFRVIEESPLEFWKALLSPIAFWESVRNIKNRRSQTASAVDESP